MRLNTPTPTSTPPKDNTEYSNFKFNSVPNNKYLILHKIEDGNQNQDYWLALDALDTIVKTNKLCKNVDRLC